MIGFTNTKDGISLTIQGKSFYVKKTASNYQEARDLYNAGDEEGLLTLLDKKTQVIEFSDNRLEIKGNTIYFEGAALPQVLSNKIVSLWEEGFNFNPFVRFYERLQRTPSNTVLTELFDFLEAGEWPLLPDGRIMAYKILRPNPHKGVELSLDEARAIREKQKPALIQYDLQSIPMEKFQEVLKTRDLIDIYTESVPQGIGDIISVPRNSVDDCRERTCSYGLHVASHSYIPHYGNAIHGDDVVVLVGVCPSDWVSVPKDYGNAKARVACYELLQVHKDLTEKRQALYDPHTAIESNDIEWEEEEDYDEDEGADWDD